MFTVSLRCITVMICVFGAFSFAGSADRTHDITMEDYFTQAVISSCAISPDGQQIAYVESRWQGVHDSASSDIWLIDVTTKAIKRLTFEPCSDTKPQWSPDGTMLYFMSSPKREAEKAPPYDGKAQVWRLDLASHRLEPVTRVEGGIADYRLSANGQSVYYTETR